MFIIFFVYISFFLISVHFFFEAENSAYFMLSSLFLHSQRHFFGSDLQQLQPDLFANNLCNVPLVTRHSCSPVFNCPEEKDKSTNMVRKALHSPASPYLFTSTAVFHSSHHKKLINRNLN